MGSRVSVYLVRLAILGVIETAIADATCALPAQELACHAASLGAICAEWGSCVAAVLRPYAPPTVLRTIFRGQHLHSPPFVQVWTTTSARPSLQEFRRFLDLSFQRDDGLAAGGGHRTDVRLGAVRAGGEQHGAPTPHP